MKQRLRRQRRLEKNNATRKNVGIALLEKDSKRGKKRRRGEGRRDGVTSNGRENAKEAEGPVANGAKSLHGEGNETRGRRGGRGRVAGDLAMLVIRSGAEGSCRLGEVGG